MNFYYTTGYYRWTDDMGNVAVPTQFYSIAIRCRNNNDISSCLVEDIQALGIVMYHEEKDEVCMHLYSCDIMIKYLFRKLQKIILNSELQQYER